MKRFSALLFALLMLALTACGVNQVSPTAPASSSPEPEPGRRVTVQFDTRTETVKNDDGVTLLTYSYPQASVDVSDSESGSAIEETINSTLTPSQDTLDQISQAAAAEYAGLDETQRESWTGYGLYYNAEVMRGDSRILSLYWTVSQMSGGSHPNNGGFGLSFDVETGERLTASSLGNEGGNLSSVVSRFVLSSISSNENIDTFYGISDFIENVLNTEQWYLSDSGLTVFANEGEIAPRAVGAMVFTMPYSDLQNSLSEKYAPVNASPLGSAGALDISSGTGGANVSAILDSGGVEFSLTTSEDITGLCINRVSMDSGGDWFATGQVLYVSYMDAGESLGLTAAFMDNPLYSVTYGLSSAQLIGDSGEDGSLLLLDP